jgi:hypothetical protein
MWVGIGVRSPFSAGSEPSFISQDANQVIIWDDIVLSAEDALLERQGIRAEYPMTDIGHSIKLDCADLSFSASLTFLPDNRDINASVSLHWNVMPSIGILFSQSSQIKIPLNFSDYHPGAGKIEEAEEGEGEEGEEQGEGDEGEVEYVEEEVVEE